MNICLFFSAETIKYFYGDGGVGKDFFLGGGGCSRGKMSWCIILSISGWIMG